MAWSTTIEQGFLAFDPSSFFAGIALAVMAMMLAFVLGKRLNRSNPPAPLARLQDALRSMTDHRGKREFAKTLLEKAIELTGAQAAAVILESSSTDENDLYCVVNGQFNSDVVSSCNTLPSTKNASSAVTSNPSDTAIDYDVPSYLPGYFPQVKASLGATLRLQGRDIGHLIVVNKQGRFDATDKALLLALSHYASQVLGNYLLIEQADLGYVATIETLIKAVESKDAYIRGHSERVSSYAVAIAKEMGLPQKQIEQIRVGALLHDIGRINMPDEILNKKGPLTDEEWKLIRGHPGFGKKALDSFTRSRDLLLTIYHHHEAYDGTGYPAGLKGNEIPLGARILRVADAFDAMTSERPYREKKTVIHAIEELLDQSGRQFDPLAVASFIRSLKNQFSEFSEHGIDLGAFSKSQNASQTLPLPMGEG